jgi:hypothetical protein
VCVTVGVCVCVCVTVGVCLYKPVTAETYFHSSLGMAASATSFASVTAKTCLYPVTPNTSQHFVAFFK